MRSRVLRAAAGTAAVALAVGAVVVPTGAPALAVAAVDCNVKIGGQESTVQPSQPWEQKRLDVQRVWPISDGSGVLVGVIDSGFNNEGDQLSKIHLRPGVNVSGVFGPTDTRDCYYHGTAVTGVIAARKIDRIFFTGIAPGVTIMPIKAQQSEEQSGSNHIAEAIRQAIAAHVSVVNISITTPVGTPDLNAAVAAANRADIVVVAAGGNDGQTGNPIAYPAAYSTRYPNVLAVSATAADDGIPRFDTSGQYITIAAPGSGVELPMPKNTYAANQDGTSYATPVVTGTAALVRAAHPDLTAAQVVSRIEATADAPPGRTVPSRQYGYGIVNPYLAVTAVRDDSAGPAPTTRPQAIAAAPPRPPADRHLQHLALGIGTILLGLSVLAGLIAAIVRRGSWFATVHAPVPPPSGE